MTRNDTFFKILFAIEIALLPLVMAAEIMMPAWSMGLFIVGILVVLAVLFRRFLLVKLSLGTSK